MVSVENVITYLCVLHQVTAYFNQCHGPVPWLLRSPDLTLLDFFLWSLIKKMTYRTKVHTREELLHQIMDAAAYIQEHPKMIQWAVNSCLE
jgi:hypothetical protein